MHANRLPHTRLLAYRLAQQLAEGVRRLPPNARGGSADIRDQLQRAAHSVVRNIAEGANRWNAADKIGRFNIAHGELGECDACLDTLQRLDLLPAERVEPLRDQAQHVGRLLGGLIRTQRARQRGGRSP